MKGQHQQQEIKMNLRRCRMRGRESSWPGKGREGDSPIQTASRCAQPERGVLEKHFVPGQRQKRRKMYREMRKCSITEGEERFTAENILVEEDGSLVGETEETWLRLGRLVSRKKTRQI